MVSEIILTMNEHLKLRFTCNIVFCWISALFLRLCSLTCGFHHKIWTSGFGFSLPGLQKWKNERRRKRMFLGLALRLTRHFVPTYMYLCTWVCENKASFLALQSLQTIICNLHMYNHARLTNTKSIRFTDILNFLH